MNNTTSPLFEYIDNYELEVDNGGRILYTPTNRKKNINFVVESINAIHKQLKADIDTYQKEAKKKTKVSLDKKGMIINVFDAHFGSLIVKEDYFSTGQGTVTYNFDIARKRLNYLFNKAVEELKTGDYDHVVINIGGDNVDGNGAVYPTQYHEIEDAAPVQVFNFASAMVSNISKIVVNFPKIQIEVVGIPGNHGSDKGSLHLNTIKFNLDTSTLKVMQGIIIKDKELSKFNKIPFTYPLNFGEIKGFNMKGWKYISQHKLSKALTTPRLKNWAMELSQITGANVIFTGHYHESAYVNAADIKVIRTGSIAGPNNYSDQLGIFSIGPEQTIVSVTKDNSIESLKMIPLLSAEE